MKIILLACLLALSLNSKCQVEGFKPIFQTICDSMVQLDQNPEIESSIDFSWLIRSSKNRHIEDWGDELSKYVLSTNGSSFHFDKYFYHLLLRDCPEFLNSDHRDQFFYSRDSANFIYFNEIRKFIIDCELSETVDTDNYSILDSLSKDQIDSLKDVTAPVLRTIGANCYLETKLQVNRAKDNYIRVTYINVSTKEREYELHFYFDPKSSFATYRVVFRSKEILQEETKRIRRKMQDFPPPPPPIRD